MPFIPSGLNRRARANARRHDNPNAVRFLGYPGLSKFDKHRNLNPPVQALTVNGAIPAPVLRFREGDVVRITVRNALRHEKTSIHWHGLLVPNAMDGVPYLTTPPIPHGGKRVFELKLRQSGTYWYHSHSGLQEQRGVYGAITDGRPSRPAPPIRALPPRGQSTPLHSGYRSVAPSNVQWSEASTAPTRAIRSPRH